MGHCNNGFHFFNGPSKTNHKLETPQNHENTVNRLAGFGLWLRRRTGVRPL
jgi:hypothetical protein